MSQKSKPISTKGYIQIDIAFVILVFFMLFLTIHNMNYNNLNAHEDQFKKNKLQTTARDICFLLTSTPGQPLDWEEKTFNKTTYIGIKNSTSNKLDINKINKLKSYTYLNITDKFETSSYVNIKINGLETETNYLNIDANIENKTTMSGNYVCYSNYNSEIVEVLVETWQ